jgi:glycosyltransferase 2 family protein
MLRPARSYLLVAVAVAALAFFLYRFRNSVVVEGFRWSELSASLGHAHSGLLFLSMVAVFVCYAIRALRWMRFSRVLGRSHFWSVYAATLMGFSCVFLLGRAGEPVRPVLIARKESLPIAGMFGVYLLERIFDLAAAVVVAALALLLFDRNNLATAESARLLNAVRSAGVVLFVGVVAVSAFLIYFRFHGREWLSRRLQQPVWRGGWRARIAALLEGFSDGLESVRTWEDLGVLVGYSALHWTLIAWVYFFVEHAFGGQLAALSLAATLLVLAFSLVGSAVQLPVAGGGAQVATFLVLTLVFGIDKAPAAAVSIVVWLIGFAACCLAGIPLLFREGLSMAELRRITREEEREIEAELLAEAEHAAHVEESPE